MKYLVKYISGSTGYSWERECNTIEQVKYLIEEKRFKESAIVTVWDREWKDFIFYKEYLSKPEVDYIYNNRSDLRTSNKLRK